MSYKTLPVLIMFSASAAFAAPAAAGHFSFSVEKYELASAEAVESTYKRLQFQVKQSCSTFGRRALFVQLAERECAAGLTDEIVASIGNLRLSQVHAAAKNQHRYAAN